MNPVTRVTATRFMLASTAAAERAARGHRP